MYPFFFGDSDKQLYGVYDEPGSSGIGDAGVLFCYPVGQEYMRSHWASRQVVGQLSRNGMHCMRFDYYGTGDSAGRFSDASLDQWFSDVSSGLTELKDISGTSRVSLLGLRMGATIAALAPPGDHRVSRLVLWDPVVNGSLYVDKLREMHKTLQESLEFLNKNRSQQQEQGVEELLGFRYSENMIAGLDAVDLRETRSFSASDIYLLVSEQREEYEQLREHLSSLGLLRGYQLASSAGEWDEWRQIENALIAGDMINLLGSAFTSRE